MSSVSFSLTQWSFSSLLGFSDQFSRIRETHFSVAADVLSVPPSLEQAAPKARTKGMKYGMVSMIERIVGGTSVRGVREILDEISPVYSDWQLPERPIACRISQRRAHIAVLALDVCEQEADAFCKRYKGLALCAASSARSIALGLNPTMICPMTSMIGIDEL